MKTRFLAITTLVIFLFGCKTDNKSSNLPTEPVKKPRVTVPKFDGAMAYQYVQKQVDFGTRVPGTPTHKECKDWLVNELKSTGAEVIVQEFESSFLTVKNAESYNIIAQFNPEKKDRILLCAHWDTRLIAEKDSDVSKQNSPIDGADDGASGVGVLLSIAKTIQNHPIDLGVDIILFDAEDNGLDGNGWCLGSQYWTKNIHRKGYRPEFGILLDMVGAKTAQFGLEGFSVQYANKYLQKVWTWADRIGAGDLFVKKPLGGIEDDHYYINRDARIPTIDIINASNKPGSFDTHHHTHQDNMDIIDQEVLRKVGQVVTTVIYKVSDGSF